MTRPKYQAQERKWVARILARLTPIQRALYEERCRNEQYHRHRNGKLYDYAKAKIAEEILLEDHR